MQLQVISSSITEPITHAQVKSFMGFPASDTSQDGTIDTMITSARIWLEQRTALSIVSKQYKAYFEADDMEDGWYELPVSPVIGTPVTTMTMNGVTTTYRQMGLNRVKIQPDSVFGTLLVGQTSTPSYMEVTFQAGATNGEANEILLGIVSFMFNNREGGTSVNIASLPWDLKGRINALSMNF